MPIPVDLSKLSDLGKNDVVKKTVYNKLVTKVNSNDTARFVLKTKHDTEKSDPGKKLSDVKNKLPDTNGLVKKNHFQMLKLLK